MADKHHVTKYGADLIVDKILADSNVRDFLKVMGPIQANENRLSQKLISTIDLSKAQNNQIDKGDQE
ncbi:hypothetical protein [Rufibacter tibetensis]|uniref:Uncharacterized protein n=1 Tax=Rufibacter tibetensis TaxID=512763 RepID=A0A0P0CTF9_9BACT|nr:hypothetical protein [Rufibacter tibetensis]ALI99893.1 hypothetical protein DC20_14080 [Rufibacter tibetensis]